MLEKKNRILWIELLRIVSCFSVILLHMGSQHFRNIPVDSYEWIVSNFFHGITRFAVACFVMISGALYLNEKRSWTPKKVAKTFLSVAVPFVFWQFLYAVFRILKYTDIELFSVKGFKRVCIYMSESYFHLWYLPMLLGLVLVTPLIWKIVNGDNGKQCSQFLLVLFFLFHILPNTINDFSFPDKEYIMNLVNLVKPDLTVGYIGYFVLGHYLSNYKISPKLEKVLYLFSVLFAGLGIYWCQYFSIKNNKATQSFYENFTIVVLLMSAGNFLFFKNYVSKINFSEKLQNIITRVGGYTFGIYLVHILVREHFTFKGIDSISFNPVLAIPLISLAIFLISLIIVAVMKKNPLIGKWLV